MFLLIVITPGIIIIPVAEESSKHLLNIVQGLLLSSGGLLLSFQTPTKVVVSVISHIDRCFVRSY